MRRVCCAGRRQRPGAAPAPVPAAAAEPSLAEAFCSAVLTPELWRCLEEQRPVHLPRAAPRLPESLGLDDVIAAFTRGGETGATSAYKRGEPYLRENLFLAYLDQATLSLADAERYLRPLLEICQGLAPTFDYVTATLILDPPECRGPPLAVDSDVLLLQLWGEQRLALRRPLVGMPVTAPRPGALLAPELRPGDALFVPGGIECQVVGGALPMPTGGGASSAGSSVPVLCALLTLRTGEQSLEASLGKLLTDLLRDGGLSAEADGFLRSAVTKRGVPERYLVHPGKGPVQDAVPAAPASGDLETKLGRFAGELAGRLSAAELRRHFAARMERLREAQREGAERALAASASMGPVPPDGTIQMHTLISVSRDVVCRCQPGSDTAYFKRGHETLNLPIASSASHLISRLSDGRPHVVGSLPCDDPMERLCVCQILVFKGCLEVVEGPGAGD